RLIRLAEFLAAVAVVIAPVTIRNYVVSRRLVLIAWQGGTNFYIGNNRYSDGITAIVPGTRSSWWGGFSDVRLKAEQALGRPLKGSEVDAYWFRQGLRYWAQEPLKALALLGRKCYLWCAGYEVSNNRDIYFFKHYTFLRLLIFRTPVLVFPFGLLLPLALAGCYLSRQGWRRLLPTYLVLTAYSLSFVVFFVTARYRMPVVVLLIPFAVLGAAGLVHSVPRERVRTWILVGAGFLLVNPDWLRVGATTASQNHFLAAKGYYETGAVRAAARELELALARDSAANVLALEGSVRLRLGELDRARQAAQAAVRLWPEDADAWGLAGNIYAQLQEPDLARQSFEQAVRLDPYSIQALNNLGNLALTRRDLDLARSYYEQALQIDPNFTLSLFHLGVVSYYENNLAQARALWERVLELDPQNDNARQALSRGLHEIGFSDHNPMPDTFRDSWRMEPEELDQYLEMVEDTQARFARQLPVRLGIECDYRPGSEEYVRDTINQHPFDYVLGSVHYLGDWCFDSPDELAEWRRRDLWEAWREYFDLLTRAARSGLFDIMAHPDLVKKFSFIPPQDCAPLFEPFLDAVRQNGLTLEISTAGLRKPVGEIYPGRRLLEMAFARGIPISLGSDAHDPSEVGYEFERGIALARSVGYQKVARYRRRRRELVPLG
ncbi:MAG: histidinol-phosphatase HisJ family protein, partial [candidate division WOR-3 bacterium]